MPIAKETSRFSQKERPIVETFDEGKIESVTTSSICLKHVSIWGKQDAKKKKSFLLVSRSVKVGN
jgi:hypothetical protein